MKKICNFCKKSFDAWRFSQKYCSKKCFGGAFSEKFEHEIRQCMQCGKKFKTTVNSKKKLCSVPCTNDYFSKKFSGQGNPNYGKRHPKMFQHTPEAKEKISVAVESHWKIDSERKNKQKDRIEKYKKEHGYYPMHSPEAMEKNSIKQIERTIGGTDSIWTNSARGWYCSSKTNNREYYQSTYERSRMIELDQDENVKFWTKRHGIIIKYNGHHRYYPDFLIKFSSGISRIEEIKGYIKDDQNFIDKSRAALKYCNENNFEYIVNFPKKKNFDRHGHLLSKIFSE